MGTVASKREFANFKEFYPYYLQEHKNKVCRRLHFIGSWFVLAIVFAALYQQQYSWLIFCPLIGYGFASTNDDIWPVSMIAYRSLPKYA